MLFWPLKSIVIESRLKQEELMRVISGATDQDQRSIYWGKRFSKKFWGKVGKKSFRIRPVVPYWNISPIELKGKISDGVNDSNKIKVRMVCPYLRIVLPLVIIALVLFFVNFGMKGELDVFLSSAAIILISAYLLVNIPFQIQAIWSIKQFTKILKGKIVHMK